MREASVDSIVEYSKPIFKPGLVVCLIIRELWLPGWRVCWINPEEPKQNLLYVQLWNNV